MRILTFLHQHNSCQVFSRQKLSASLWIKISNSHYKYQEEMQGFPSFRLKSVPFIPHFSHFHSFLFFNQFMKIYFVSQILYFS